MSACRPSLVKNIYVVLQRSQTASSSEDSRDCTRKFFFLGFNISDQSECPWRALRSSFFLPTVERLYCHSRGSIRPRDVSLPSDCPVVEVTSTAMHRCSSVRFNPFWIRKSMRRYTAFWIVSQGLFQSCLDVLLISQTRKQVSASFKQVQSICFCVKMCSRK